jgi:GNAT superfamily N-acetyltransferase
MLLTLATPPAEGGYTVQVEHLATALGETLQLHAEHWREVEQAHRGTNFNPDFADLMAAVDRGHAVFLTLREHGELVGYAYIRLRHSSTSKHLRHAHVVHFFVRAEHRKGWTPVRFMRRIVELARHYGADEIFFTAKHAEHGKDLSPIMKRLGMEPDTITYYMRLKGEP